jgi:hypothetical protein
MFIKKIYKRIMMIQLAAISLLLDPLVLFANHKAGHIGSVTDPNNLGNVTDPNNLGNLSDPNLSGNMDTLNNPLGDIGVDNIPKLIEKILELVVLIGTPVVALFIIWSGFLFVSAQGNPTKLTTARTTLMYTLIGAALVLGATVIAKAIGGTIAKF